jgi:deoxyribodipyrimidine photolyase
MVTPASSELTQSFSSLPESFSNSLQTFSKAAEAFSALSRIVKKSAQAFKAAVTKFIQSKVKKNSPNKQLKATNRTHSLSPHIRGFLSVAPRLLARLTINSQSSNSPPAALA